MVKKARKKKTKSATHIMAEDRLRAHEDIKKKESNELDGFDDLLHRFIEFTISLISRIYHFLRCCFICFLVCCFVCFHLCRVIFFLYYRHNELRDLVRHRLGPLINELVDGLVGDTNDRSGDRVHRFRQLINEFLDSLVGDTNDSSDHVHRFGQMFELLTGLVADTNRHDFLAVTPLDVYTNNLDLPEIANNGTGGGGRTQQVPLGVSSSNSVEADIQTSNPETGSGVAVASKKSKKKPEGEVITRRNGGRNVGSS
ncbi:hypothetical protein L1987_56938 [Smallanthus sonchifolius]|uniref:Uncharacterized protein n=1 Tax=Smallanthus sonchifolius TaxID=185202 RepID=A0ACB9DBM7_9ASTR|nr:hypothetical protein L1987_56938 [Smallanthus sonchifolius]